MKPWTLPAIFGAFDTASGAAIGGAPLTERAVRFRECERVGPELHLERRTANRWEQVSGDTVQDVPAIPPVFANKYNIYVNRTSKEISKSCSEAS